ncbi:hypothetical protein AAFF_G00047630 [Aldrovandia affinis]|uniref:Reverse transcriptase domain-containing protein n=1 Tax=Aldrovandia affinis TaxID=143900 RepID=A0AAD7S3Z3_9TELE|nr:hypothetical protein AAFF_G00047630 [Aldrovandia affinis]
MFLKLWEKRHLDVSSHLILFICYPDDCRTSHPDRHLVMFADDTVLLLPKTMGLPSTSLWSGVTLCLELNVTKTKEMVVVFSYRQQESSGSGFEVGTLAAPPGAGPRRGITVETDATRDQLSAWRCGGGGGTEDNFIRFRRVRAFKARGQVCSRNLLGFDVESEGPHHLSHCPRRYRHAVR